jgi:hypothetical protein
VAACRRFVNRSRSIGAKAAPGRRTSKNMTQNPRVAVLFQQPEKSWLTKVEPKRQ